MARRTAGDRRAALRRGDAAESRVAALLEAQGWSVVARNWRGGGGELDLVVLRDHRLRFVEVKARAPGDLVGAVEAIGRRKRARLSRAAEAFLQSYAGEYDEACFLVAAVEGDEVELWDDAFDGEG